MYIFLEGPTEHSIQKERGKTFIGYITTVLSQTIVHKI